MAGSFKKSMSAFDLAGLDQLDLNPGQDDNWKTNPFYDKVGEHGFRNTDTVAQITDPEYFGKGAEGYQLTKQSDDSYAAHSLNYEGVIPSGNDFPDGFLDNMFDNENWKSLTPQAQQALYNKAFLGDYLWDRHDKIFNRKDFDKITAAEQSPSSDKVWGTSQDSTHGLDIARVIPGSAPEQGNYSDNDLYRMAHAAGEWEKGTLGNTDSIAKQNMDMLYKHMTEGEIDWAHYNGDGLYQAAAWQLDQDGNKHWIDQSASGFSTVDQIRSADALLGTMNAKEEAQLLNTWKKSSLFPGDGPGDGDSFMDPDIKIPYDYQTQNPDDTYNTETGKWQHKNSAGTLVDRHYIPTYQRKDYQIPDPGDPLKFVRVDEDDPRAGQWDTATKTLAWGGKDIDAIRNTKITPRSDIVPPTFNIPTTVTQSIYRPDNLPKDTYSAVTSDGKYQSLTVKDGKVEKGAVYHKPPGTFSNMTIKAGGK